MAFPVPSHLPRKQPTDVSSAIIGRISDVDSKSLNAALAEVWIAELDESIQAAKQLIHERIQRDLPSFSSQLTAAGSIRSRFQTLKENTDKLSDTISNPASGLAPNLIRALTQRSRLAQSTLDAETKCQNLQYAAQLSSEFQSFAQLVYNGELPEAIRSSSQLSTLLEQAPIPLRDASLTHALKRKHRSLRDRAEELLSDAYTRSIVLTPTACGIRPHVQVHKSSKMVSLHGIISSLSPTSLSERLAVLRRDIIAHFIEFALTQPLSITRSGNTGPSSASIEHRLELFPAPPNLATLVSRLDNLSEILEFLNIHLFGAIPPSQRVTFLKSFSKPLTSGILNHLLIPSIPTSLSGLPKYLELLERAVKFESDDLTRVLFGPTFGVSTGTEIRPENEIKNWARGIISHYQKKRRVDILDQARRMFVDISSDWHETFQVEWTLSSVGPALSANGSTLPESVATSRPPSAADRPPTPGTNGTNGVDRDVEIQQVDNEGWGFDEADDGADEEITSPDQEARGSPAGSSLSSLKDPDAHSADEVDDAWGWNDEEDPEPTPVDALNEREENGGGNTEHGANGDDPLWDAWDDPPSSPTTKKVLPKPAKKLEKFSSKSKQGAEPPKIVTQPPERQPIPVPSNAPTHANSNHLPGPASLSSSWSSSSSSTSQQFQSIPPTPASTTAQNKAPKEFYSVSSGMQDIAELVESVIFESSEFSRSNLLATYLPALNPGTSASLTSGGAPGSVILNTVPSILDLFRAIYPLRFHSELESGNRSWKGAGKSASTEGITRKAIQFSNDCLYLEERIREYLPAPPRTSSAALPPNVWANDGGLRAQAEDAAKRVGVYGESWFVRAIEMQLNEVDEMLDATEGFVDTSDQDRFDTYEETVNAVVKKVKRVWQVWKGILPQSRHLTAIGRIVDAILSRMLEEITRLPDITADESHRLSELCRMVNALEGLFVEGPDQTSAVVSYVPSWLKFSYLSEVLEASMADITYLFEEGALVDFEIDELVKLVTALFSDTPLRAETIQKLQGERIR